MSFENVCFSNPLKKLWKNEVYFFKNYTFEIHEILTDFGKIFADLLGGIVVIKNYLILCTNESNNIHKIII
jgi:hypothetical protein